MFIIHNSTNYFEYLSLCLVKIFFITLELNSCFWITATIVEDNPNSNIYGIFTKIEIFAIYIVIFPKFVFRYLGKVALIRKESSCSVLFVMCVKATLSNKIKSLI